MPVAFLFEGDGIGQDEYDRLMERVGRAEEATGAFYGWPLEIDQTMRDLAAM
jgi:hypothetical protein